MTEIEMPKLTKYLQEREPKRDINVQGRMHFIEKQNVYEFFRYRGHVTLPPPPVMRRDMSTREKDALCEEYFKPITDGESMARGVEYHITEAHRHFNSDRWADMGHLIMFYLTQHRHFDDNVVIESQLPKQVVIQLRDLGEECWEMTNRYKQQMGWFQKPGGIHIKKYYKVPKTDSAEPYATETFTLDPKGIASCYRTRGAVGTGSASPETDVRKKGLPFWTVFVGAGVALALAVLAIWMLPKLVMGGLGAMLKHTGGEAKKAMSDSLGLPHDKKTPAPNVNPAKTSRAQPPERPPGQTPPEETPEVFATGYMTSPGRGVIVTLSDGTRKTTVRGLVENLEIKGEKYELKRRKTEPPRVFVVQQAKQ